MDKAIIICSGSERGNLFTAFDRAKRIIENCGIPEIIIIFFGVRILVVENTEWEAFEKTFRERLGLLQTSGGAEALREEYEREGLLIGDKERRGDRLIDFSV